MQNLSNLEPLCSSAAVAEIAAPLSEDHSLIKVSSAAPTAALPPALLPNDGSLAPILVADDDDDDRYFIKRIIGKTGIENPVLAFQDGTEVVNYLGALVAAGAPVRHRVPRLMFLDLRMNGLGGFGFLEWVRQQKPALPLTVVVLSNSVQPDDVTRAMELGAHRYLVKYPSLQTFTTIVRSVYPFHYAK
jgi:CheY-like chemotaxis protein